MDLLVAMAVWSLGAWVAYRWARRQGVHHAGADTEPRRRQEGMDVRRRRGHDRGYRPGGADAASSTRFLDATRCGPRRGPGTGGS